MSINVTRSSMPTYEEYCEEIKDLWETRWLTNMGAKHNALYTLDLAVSLSLLLLLFEIFAMNIVLSIKPAPKEFSVFAKSK